MCQCLHDNDVASGWTACAHYRTNIVHFRGFRAIIVRLTVWSIGQSCLANCVMRPVGYGRLIRWKRRWTYFFPQRLLHNRKCQKLQHLREDFTPTSLARRICKKRRLLFNQSDAFYKVRRRKLDVTETLAQKFPCTTHVQMIVLWKHDG